MSDSTHCKDCDRTWSGYAECHCSSCHRHFAGLTAFDAHLKILHSGAIEHVDPPAKSGFLQLDRASGPTWGQEMDQTWLLALRETGKRQSDGQAEDVPLVLNKKQRSEIVRSVRREDT